MGIHVQSLSEQIYNILRDRLVSGSLTPRDAIRQDALAAELGVSKIPIREALIRLENEGLIVLEANRGFFVPPLTLEEAEDVYTLRLSMEPQAVGLAATRTTEADRRQARAALDDLQHAAETNKAEIGRYNRLFHLSLIHPVRKPVTVRFIERLHLISERNVGEYLIPAGSEDQAHQEHEIIYDHWANGRADEVIELVHRHINATFQDLITEYSQP
ncbi:hypothetical protein AEAC466_09880 [Asticcacaulis sp. AC466]|uniref:GntR family transcriptional regulator n=1 Tax=Asticcacaulis sp. AC466 TaxID=1282362 RepID=UPI0003C3C610|nr:GntR family transcriptional regulator [Asticcacaulis sp. AC466]ESQ84044.1 hypothetical protein AEAC466_09880 [Asticcacaulis sp. AC466]